MLPLFALACGAYAQPTDAAGIFEKQIRPLLIRRCQTCHSAANAAMGGLRLDSEEGLRKGGGRGMVVVAGRPDQSLLLRAVSYNDEGLRMPPTGKLSDAEIAALTQWVRMGARWGTAPETAGTGTHWSFQPISEPPGLVVEDPGWGRSPMDRFVLAALEAKGLGPAPAADKRTLIRRATFDLTGLPPVPAEIRAFLADDSKEAFEKVIERLMASPRYGERWGRHWLDVARYADSNGLDENLVYKNAYRYRDYVIAAFNKDKPFDQFIHEQLAGDLLPASDDLQTMYERWTATGFLSLGAKMLAEDDPVKMRMDIIDEQLETTARAFMGLTLGCARCHDHKFDPISQADYYSMAGIFHSSKTMENFKVVAKWHEYVLASKEDRDRLKDHEEAIQAKTKQIAGITKAENAKLVDAGRQRTGAYLRAAGDALRYKRMNLEPMMPEANPAAADAAMVRPADAFARGNVRRELERGKKNIPASDDDEKTKGPYFAEYDVEITQAGDYQIDFQDQEKGRGTADLIINGVLVKTGLEPVRNRAASPEVGGWSVAGIFRLEAGRNVIRLEHGSQFPYFEKLLIAPSRLVPGADVPKTLDQLASKYDVNPGFLRQWVERLDRSKGAPNSVFFAWHAFESGETLDGWTSPAKAHFLEFPPARREDLAARYEELFRRSVRRWQALYPESDVDFEKRERYKKDGAERKLPDAGLEEFRKVLYEKFGPFRPPPDSKEYFPRPKQDELAAREKEKEALVDATPEFPRAMGVTEGADIGDIPIHLRGSHWTLGETVPRRFLGGITGSEQPAVLANASGRLQLAQWLTNRSHPLTSRVMANRIWRWHFGKGIVASTDNFGRLGDPPSNQPLLDWLALRFIDGGWSVKKMHRLIMLSSTYQMSTAANAKAAEIDPENRLHWRANRRRLEVEAIRDAIVAMARDLDFTMGGSMLTYKDREYVANTKKKGDIDYDRNLRAVYMPVVRSSMYDLFMAFDLPDSSTANGDRNSSVVAPQALFMMNGSILLKSTRKMAESLLATSGIDDGARVRLVYEKAFGRLPSRHETDRALTFVHRIGEALRNRAGDPGDRRLRAWQSFCKSVIASNEFIYLN